jgi:hypothetical protein
LAPIGAAIFIGYDEGPFTLRLTASALSLLIVILLSAAVMRSMNTPSLLSIAWSAKQWELLAWDGLR